MSKLLQYLEKIAPQKFSNLYLEQMREARFLPPRNEFLDTMRFLKELERRIYKEPKSFSSSERIILKDYYDDLYVNSENNYISLWFNLSGEGSITDVSQSLSCIEHWFAIDACKAPSVIVFVKQLLDNKHNLFRFDVSYIEGCTYVSNSGRNTHSLDHEDLLHGECLTQTAKMVGVMTRELFYVDDELRNLDPFDDDGYRDSEQMSATLTFKGDLHFLNKGQSIYSRKDFELRIHFAYIDTTECCINTDFFIDAQSLLLFFLYDGQNV